MDRHELGGVTVRMFDLWSKSRWFNCRSGHCQVVTSMGDCLRESKPSRYI